MTKFKICGLREVRHAVAAADAGADFLGFAFVEGVRRQLAVDAAAEIIQEYRALRPGLGPRLVGLFANQSADLVNETVRRCGLDLAQLCGDEPPEFAELVDVGVIRQIKVRDDGPAGEAQASLMRTVDGVASRGNIVLLDRYEAGSLGGTGRSFNWDLARKVAESYEVVLAGGLSPDNVGEAIGLVRPWGVDVSSGVEIDGVKDLAKIAAFADAVKTARAG